MYTDAELESGTDLPFDCRPAAATLDDLNLDFIERHYLPNAIAPDVLAANARTLKHQLRSLRLLNGEQPVWGATLGLGKDPRAFLPGAYIQFLRVDGASIMDPIIKRIVRVPLTRWSARVQREVGLGVGLGTQLE